MNQRFSSSSKPSSGAPWEWGVNPICQDLRSSLTQLGLCPEHGRRTEDECPTVWPSLAPPGLSVRSPGIKQTRVLLAILESGWKSWKWWILYFLPIHKKQPVCSRTVLFVESQSCWRGKRSHWTVLMLGCNNTFIATEHTPHTHTHWPVHFCWDWPPVRRPHPCSRRPSVRAALC